MFINYAVLEKIIFLSNNYEINCLILPIQSIAEKFFISKYNEIKNFSKFIKQVTIVFKKTLSKLLKNGLYERLNFIGKFIQET